MDKPTFYTLLDRFVALVETEKNESTKKKYLILHESAIKEGRRGYNEVGYDEGPKFVKVWVESGGQRFVHTFVEKETGIIWGAAGWKQRNKNRQYGNLSVMDEWYWGDYYGRPTDGSDLEAATLVPKSKRR